MALKINITAQISNLAQLKKKIQNYLKNIKISLDTAAKTNVKKTDMGISETNKYTTALRLANIELEKLLKKKQISSKTELTDKKFIAKVQKQAAIMESLGKSIDDISVKYGGYRRAIAEVEKIQLRAIRTKIQENEIKKRSVKQLKDQEAAIKGTYGNKFINMLEKANTKARELSNSFRFSNKTKKDTDSFINSVNRLAQGLVKEGVVLKDVKGKYTALGAAIQKVDDIKNKSANIISKESQTLANLETKLIKLKSVRGAEGSSQAKYIKDIYVVTNQMKQQNMSITQLESKYLAFAEANKQLSKYTNEQIQTLIRKNKLMTEEELRLDQLSLKLNEENKAYAAGSTKMNVYMDNIHKIMNLMAQESLTIDQLIVKYGSYEKAFTNITKAKKEQEKSASKRKEVQELSEVEKELIRVNDLYKKRILNTREYLKAVNTLKNSESGLTTVNQKLLTQTQALSTYASFKNGTISAAEYDKALKQILADKQKLAQIDTQTLSIMTKQSEEIKKYSKLADYLNNLSSAYERRKLSAENFLNLTNRITNDTKKYAALDTDTQKKIAQAREKATKEVRKNNNSLMNYFKNMGMVVKKIFDWAVGTTLVYAPMQAIRNGVKYIIEMDTALTELSKVTNLTTEQLVDMKDSAIDLGKQLGVSSAEIMKSMAEFGRVNKDPANIKELSIQAAMASKITTMTADEAAKAFNTTMILYKKNVSDVGHILNSLNNIQNNYRTSAQDLTESIDKVGMAAQQTGVSMEMLEGYTTAIVSATGLSGSEAGTALKSIISRVYRIGSEGEGDAGKAMKALEGVGVQVRQMNGEFRDFDVVLKELNTKWKDMTTAEKTSVAQAVAGTYHYSKFLSLMNNFDIAVSASETALNSAGSAVNEYNKYLNSAEGRLGKLTSTIQDKFNKALDIGIIKGSISVITVLIETFGDLEVAIALATTAFFAFKGAAITTAVIGFAASIGNWVKTFVALTKETKLATTAMAEFQLIVGKILKNPLVIAAAAVASIMLISKTIEEAKEREIAARKENIDNIVKEAEQLTNIKNIYKDNYKDVKKDDDAKAKLLEVQKQLIESYGIEAANIDLINGKYKENIKQIEKLAKEKSKGRIELAISDLEKVKSEKYSPIKGDEALYRGMSGFMYQEEGAYGKYFSGEVLTLEEAYEKTLEFQEQILKSKKIESGLDKGRYSLEIKGQTFVVDKMQLLKKVTEELDIQSKKLGEIEIENRNTVEAIKTQSIEGKKFNELQKSIFDAAEKNFKRDDAGKYRENVEKLTKQLDKPVFKNLQKEAEKANKDLSQGSLTIDDYNKKMIKFRNTAVDVGVKMKDAKGFFRLTTDIEPTVTSLEDLEKAASKSETEYSKLTTNIDHLSDAYSKLLANENLDKKTKMDLLKAYPQLSDAIDNNAKLLESIIGIYKLQKDTVQETYENFLELNNEYYENSLESTDNYFKDIEDKYGVDLEAYINYINLKETAQNKAFNTLGKNYVDSIEENIKTAENEITKLEKKLEKTKTKKEKTKISGDLEELKKSYALLLASKKLEDLIIDNVSNMNMDEQAKIFEEAAKAYEKNFQDIISNVNELGEAMITLQKGENISSENLSKLIIKYPELASVMGNQKELLKTLTNLHISEANAAKIAYEAMLEYSTEYYKNISKQSETYFKDLQIAYGIDLENYSTYAQAKADMSANIVKYAGEGWEKDLEGTKAKLEGMVSNIPSFMEGSASSEEIINALGQVKALIHLKNKTAEIMKGIDFKTVGFDELKDKEAAKEAANHAEIVTERYRLLNAELEKTNFLINENNEAQTGKEGQELIDLLNIEVSLLKRKQNNLHAIAEEKRKERNETKAALINSGLGFSFTGVGDETELVNSKQVLDSLAAQVNRYKNAVSDEDKKTYDRLKDQYDKYNELVEKFFDIQFTDLPDLRGEYSSIVSEIKNIFEDISAETINMLEKDYDAMDKILSNMAKEADTISKEMEFLGDTDYVGKIDNLNQQIEKNDEIIRTLTEDINKLKNTEALNEDVQKSLNDKIEEYSDQLDNASYENRKLQKEIKDTTEAQKEANLATVETNFGKYINYIKKLFDEYKDAVDEQIEQEEERFNNFKENKENEIKLLEEEADKIKETEEREKKLADIRKQQALIAKLKQQETSRVYKEGEGWVWTADVKKVEEEQNNLKTMIEDYNSWEEEQRTSKQKQALQDEIDAEQESFNKFKDGLEKKVKELEKVMKQLDNIVDKDNYITSWNALMNSLDGIDPKFYEDEKKAIEGFFTDIQGVISDQKIDVSSIQNQLRKIFPPEFLAIFDQIVKDTSTGDTGTDINKLTSQEKINKMKENSKAWLTAADSEKKALEQQNYELGTSMGWTRNEASGFWYNQKGKLAYTVEGQKYTNQDLYYKGASEELEQGNLTKDQAIIKLKANSEEWKTANEERRKTLENENAKLIKENNLPYERKADGHWYNTNDGTMVYKRGGLVDYTGLAWLDGSKSNPEMVLSAAQTRSFQKLVDNLPTLENMQTSTVQKSEIFNINEIKVVTNDAKDFVTNMKKIINRRGG